MKKNTLMFILMIFMAVVTLVLSVGLIMFFDLRNDTVKETDEADTDTKVYEELYIHGFDKSIVSNVRDSKKYIRFNCAIEVGDILEYEKIKKNEKMITDIVIKILRDKNEEDYSGDGIQETIKNDIWLKIYDYLKLESIQNIYITEFVIQ